MVEDNNLGPLDPTTKKKKNSPDDTMEQKTESLSVSGSLEPTFNGSKKKKKKPIYTDLLDDVKDNGEEGEGIVLEQQRLPREGTDRVYTYEELLGRVFRIIHEHDPELAGDRRRTVFRPPLPQVLREGTKKTVFVNFMDLCKSMRREPEHVMTFLLAELGNSGSLDGQQRLVVKGRYAPKNFEAILRRYLNEYVICNGCKSPETSIKKKNRISFLICEKCGSDRSVGQIKAGFRALVGRRKAGT
ncbi:putative translation initiation factor IF2/IF5 [Helianthus annuus]|nr:putative translation initiation factor IF2/IF5 [Helianthus annuus]